MADIQTSTEKFIDSDEISFMKKDSVIINLSREGIVNTEAILNALNSNDLKNYVTDFPSKELIDNPNVINMPHLGASTNEAEVGGYKEVIAKNVFFPHHNNYLGYLLLLSSIFPTKGDP